MKYKNIVPKFLHFFFVLDLSNNNFIKNNFVYSKKNNIQYINNYPKRKCNCINAKFRYN